MPREAPVFYEYVDKRTLLPRWSQQPQYLQHSSPQSHAPTQQAPAQPPASFVVVNQSNRPVSMQALMQLFSHYAIPPPRQLSSQQPVPPQSSDQHAPSNQPHRTVVIIIQGDQPTNTDDILNRMFLAQQPQTIPAAQSFINSLQQTPITQDTMAKQAQCTVCMEEFHVDEKATQLPCLHLFHQDCIKPWLSTQHTCPMCRHELPTDVPTQISHQLPVFPALPLPPNITEQIPQQVSVQPTSTPISEAPIAPLALPAPPSPLPSPATTSALPSPATSPFTATGSTVTPIEDSHTPASGTKRSVLPPTEEQASKKTKVEKQETKDQEGYGMKRGFLLPKGEQTNKKEKVEDKSETQSRTRQGGNEFGFKKGFLLR